MRLHVFGPDVGIPIGQFGSDFRLSPLTDPAGKAHVACFHLRPGGRVGRHEATVDQLLCVVAGRGWVAGGDGVVRPIGPGEAASWVAGEEHETGTDDGLTAIVVEGRFEVWATEVVGDPIVVADPDPAWPEWFRQVEAYVAPAIGDLGTIEHVGSTSVPGLAAKPIVDVDIVLGSPDDVPEAMRRLRTIGYFWRGDLGIEGRQAFRLTTDPGLPRHHLYVVVAGTKPHLDHVRFRDHLRADPEAARRYGDLKKANAGVAGGDIRAYGAAKHALIEELIMRPGP